MYFEYILYIYKPAHVTSLLIACVQKLMYPAGTDGYILIYAQTLCTQAGRPW